MRGLGAGLVLLATASNAVAATLAVELRDERGAPVTEGVVWAVPEARRPARPARVAVMDQRNRSFVPHVLAIQTGTLVRFPNSDNIRHQVYSFSPAKRFQLPLYEGSPPEPIVFDRPGVVSIGCNIHDNMSAYIVVVDTPHFALLRGGRAEIADLPDGAYAVHAWSPDMRREPAARTLSLAGGERREVAISLGSK